MALNRMNPRGDLKKTASDLATFIMHGTQDELMKCLLEAKEIYRAPLNSWLTWPIYSLINSRTRFPRLDQTITQILSGYNESNFGKIIDIFSAGGWEETSYNTTLVRTLVKHLIGYDASVVLTLQDVIELKVLLILEQTRLINQNQILKQQSAIDRLKAKENEMRNELGELTRVLREHQTRCAEIQKDEQLTDARLQELTGMCRQQEQSLEQFQQQLKQLEIEKKKQEEELKTKKLLTLDANIDVSKLTPNQKEEAKKIAATSISMYMKDIEHQGKEREDLQSVTSGKFSRAASQLASNGMFKVNAEAREAELGAITVASGVNDGFKKQLAALLGSRAVPAKNPIKKSAEAVRKEKLAALYSEGQIVKTDVDMTAIAVVDDYKPKEEAISFIEARQALATLFARRIPQASPAVDSEPAVKQQL